MRNDDRIRSYLQSVLGQIRWKKARPAVEKELEGHLEEHIQTAMEKGLSEESAVSEAVQAMGDPTDTGRRLDRLHRPRVDVVAWIATLSVLISAYHMPPRESGFFWDFRPIGVIVFIACAFIDVRRIFKSIKATVIIGIISLAGLFAMNLMSNYIRLWPIGNDWFYFACYLCIAVFLAAFGCFVSELKPYDTGKLVAAVFALLAAVASLLTWSFLRPYFPAVCLFIACLVMLWRSRINKKLLAVATAFIVLCAVIYIAVNTEKLLIIFRYDNRSGFIDDDMAAQLKQALAGLPLFGEYPGLEDVFSHPLTAFESVFTFVFLKYGIIPGILLVAAVLAFTWRVLRASFRVKDPSGRIIGPGCAAFLTAMSAGGLLMHLIMIGTSGTYIPFLSYRTEFTLASALTGILSGIYLRKDLYGTGWTVLPNGISAAK